MTLEGILVMHVHMLLVTALCLGEVQYVQRVQCDCSSHM